MGRMIGGMLGIYALRSMGVNCVNRDEAGTPKTVHYGGGTRSRWSSQAIKSSMREVWENNPSVSEFFRGQRTLNTEDEVLRLLLVKGLKGEDAKNQAERLNEILQGDKSQKKAKKQAKTSSEGTSSEGVKENSKPISNEIEEVDERKKPLLFISTGEMEALANLLFEKFNKHEDFAKKDIVKLLGFAPEDGLEISIFGRMFATLPELSVEACTYMAHAISTHNQSPEIDFYVAMDDLANGKTGAAYMDNAEFTSSVMYECFVINVAQLFSRYGHFTKEAKKQIVSSIVKAFMAAIPIGKKHGMFSNTPMSYVLALRWKTTPLNLVDAFNKSVTDKGDGLVEASIGALKDYRDKVQKSYGAEYGVKQIAEFVLGETEIGEFADRLADEFIE